MSLTYPEVGGTAGPLPAGYHHLRASRVLGHGRDRFEQAAEALMTWQVQRGAGRAVQTTADRAAPGLEVRVRLGAGPLGLSAPCRVVYVVDEPDRRGWAYGTLPGHPESGEELFVVSLVDDEVRFEVVAFSRPARWFSRAGGPAGRLVQRAMTQRYLRAL